ncbi:response regulator transcription factor [Cellulomonas sp. SLBN-39]|uniref:response regulator n=1 Tax=Cellulomonas sp. SLBN-39 TaxID=2768446 RepID=UPI002103002D|nr:response regulator transcription factor [Cellulomonas sp. SLBN-39]
MLAGTASPVTRVVVADDQDVVREGIAAMLDASPDLEVVGTAADGRAAVDLVARTRPDLALLDVRMPVMDGISATGLIVAAHPTIRVLVLTTYDLDEYVDRALAAGAGGFVLKDSPVGDLVDAVRLVAGGAMLLGPRVNRRAVAGPDRQAWKALVETLTPRERDVLDGLMRGLSNTEIAAELVVAEETVKSHVSEVLRKTGCRDRVQVVVAAYRGQVPTTAR